MADDEIAVEGMCDEAKARGTSRDPRALTGPTVDCESANGRER